MLTEEIHVTRLEQVETVQQTVPIKAEHAVVERLDADGNVVKTISPEQRVTSGPAEAQPVQRRAPASSERVLSNSRSILRDRPKKER